MLHVLNKVGPYLALVNECLGTFCGFGYPFTCKVPFFIMWTKERKKIVANAYHLLTICHIKVLSKLCVSLLVKI